MSRIIATLLLVSFAFSPISAIAQEAQSKEEAPEAVPIYLFVSEEGNVLGIVPISPDLAVGCVVTIATSTAAENSTGTPPEPECALLTVEFASSTPSGDSGAGVEQRIFAGTERDTESNLDYMINRYYSSDVGRFLSQDPSFLDVGSAGFEQQYGRTLQQHLAMPQAQHSYSYALNNPVIHKDPEGEIVPLLVGAYLAFEIGLSAYDAYTTAATLADPNASGGEKAFTGGAFLAGLALPGGGYGTAANKAAQLAKNAEQGKAFENVVGKLFGKDNAVTAKQVTIQAKDGTKTRVDFIGRDACGNCSIIEAKSSQTAPLTKNQQAAFPQIGQSGGTVVGAGKPGFPGGTQIPPTKVNVVRP